MKKLCLLLAILSLLLAACGSGQTTAEEQTTTPEATEATRILNWGNVPVISTSPGCGMETVPNVE